MGHWEREYGEIEIPPKEWPALKRAVVEAHTRFRERVLTEAKKLHERLKSERPGDRGSYPDYHGRALELAGRNPSNVERAVAEAAVGVLGWHESERGGCDFSRMPRVPTRKRLDAAALTRSVRINDAQIAINLAFESTIRLDTPKRTIFWSVEEGRHVIEAAHSHPVAVALFEALDLVRWTRASGGVFYGNDELNSEAGGGDYLTQGFGPEGEREGAPMRRGVGRKTRHAFAFR